MSHSPTPQQEEIYRWFRSGDGNLLVRARAGCGKTTTIVEGISWAPEQRILLAAFNKRIQQELQARLKQPYARAQTLHSLGYTFLRRAWPKAVVSSDRGPSIARLAIQTVLHASGPDGLAEIGRETIQELHRLVSLVKSVAPYARGAQIMAVADEYDARVETFQDLEGDETKTAATTIAAVEWALDRALTEDGYIDYDDMLYVPVRNGLVRPWFDLVVVDEAQDMNSVQLELARQACSGRMAIVGDDRQAIYGFRGAEPGALERLKDDLKAQEMPLTVTFRCPRSVVRIAQGLVPDFTAAPSAPAGTFRRIPDTALLSQVRPGDFLLSRTNAPLSQWCLRLLRSGVRAHIVGRDIGQRLIRLVDRQKAVSITDLFDKLDRWKEREVAKAQARRSRIEEHVQRIEDEVAVIEAVSDGCATLDGLLQRLHDLFSDSAQDSVVCSSVHRIKGLEADRVFILEDTLYVFGTREDDPEEANIHYVAVTRSRDTLTLVYDAERQRQRQERRQ